MLTVVTHTRNDRPDLLARAAASIEAALVPGVQHKIIECHDDWGKARLDATQLDEYVAFVDDDDTIPPDALRRCLEVAKLKRPGLVVTDEMLVDLEGNLIAKAVGVKTYAGMHMHPRIAHHLCLIRSDAVDPAALELHRAFGNMGVDWAIKTSAAMRGDAIHVPFFGYHWTQHAGTMNRREKQDFGKVMHQFGLEMRRRWPREDRGDLPVWGTSCFP